MLGTFIPTTMAVSSLTALTLLPSTTLRLRPRFLFGEGRSRGVATHAVAVSDPRPETRLELRPAQFLDSLSRST
jgi:hypothetical protein